MQKKNRKKKRKSQNSENEINRVHRIRDLNPLIRDLNPLIRNLNLLLTSLFYFHLLDFRGSATRKALIRNLNLPGAFLQRRYFKNFKLVLDKDRCPKLRCLHRDVKGSGWLYQLWPSSLLRKGGSCRHWAVLEEPSRPAAKTELPMRHQ